ncbi:MAG: divalent-cation tolerance protein CutA [Nanoarchaeota archaeon]|nr:MAG: divalent-cation tolerance protein CutA [Nanoarchaeota archaeon]
MMMIYVTCPTSSEADLISKHLVDKKLVACANIFPVKSIYNWKNKMIKRDETAIIMKTVKINFKKVENEILKLHSDKIPCIVGYEMKEIHRGYLKWLEKNVK